MELLVANYSDNNYMARISFQSTLQKDTTDKSNTGQAPENYTCMLTELESVAETEEC